MAKQKFQCVGVVRKTGQRVAAVVSAESKEAAIKIAAEHGVLVEQATPVADATPPSSAAQHQPAQPSATVPPAGEDLEESVEGLLDSPDDELDDVDLGGVAGAAELSPSATKACPYCGEEILAVAIKCKHCGSYVAERTLKTSQPLQKPQSRAKLPRLWVAIIAGAAAIVVIVIIVAAMWPKSPAPSFPIDQLVASPSPAPAALQPPPQTPKAETPKASPEEVAFAAKLVAFLDACDETAKLLESVPKQGKFEEQTKVLKARWAAIPAPPKDVAWAADATASSKELLDAANNLANVLSYGNMVDEALRESGQPSGAEASKKAWHDAAELIRKFVAPIRGRIPPACLSKK